MKYRILIPIFSLFACVLNAQTATEKKVMWDYPVKPGMEEWNQLKTEQERIDAVQIPKTILEKIVDEAFSSLPGVLFSVRIMASILDVEEYQELKLSPNRQTTTQFIQTGILSDVSLIDEILRATDDYISTKKQTK